MRYFNKRDITRFLQETDDVNRAIDYFRSKGVSLRKIGKCIKRMKNLNRQICIK